MSVTPTFTLQSGIGSYKGTPKSPTTVFTYTSSANQVKAQNEQLVQLKEQYLRLKAQYAQETKENNARIMSLERQLRNEQQILEQKEKELAQLRSKSGISHKAGSIQAVEKIWDIMNNFREKIKKGALQQQPNEDTKKCVMMLDDDLDDELQTKIRPRAVFSK